jgi:ribose-phosphate pyrophosphokinase
MKIFSGTSNNPLAEKIAKKLDTQLSPLEIFVFPDGEKRVRVVDSVVDQKAIIVQSTSNPADHNYMELFFIADALKRSGASSITAVIPYLGYQRQDHVFRDGEAVSLQVIVETLEAVGVSKIITFDLHSIRIPSLFNIPIIHLSALELFAGKIKELHESSIIDLKSSVLVSPDMGGIRRIKILSEYLDNMPFTTIEKDRDLETGEVSAKNMEGEVEGKTAIIVDDMISTGGTILTAANLLLEKGVKEIFVFATHPVFSGNAKEVLKKVRAEKIFITDSIYLPEEKHPASLEVLSLADIIGEALVTGD